MKHLQQENPVFAVDLSHLSAVLSDTESLDWILIALPITDYQTVHTLQQNIVELKKNNQSLPNVLITVEHYPVFTMGNRGDDGNLLVSEYFLEQQGITLARTKRGGHITYHGPGQLVLYPIISLKKTGLSLPLYIYQLEEIMLQTLKEYELEAERSDRGHGIWIGNRKIGSVGIAVRHGISYHGLALNVTTNLTPFNWINPCGLNGITIRSLETETRHKPDIESVRQRMLFHFQQIFKTEVACIFSM